MICCDLLIFAVLSEENRLQWVIRRRLWWRWARSRSTPAGSLLPTCEHLRLGRNATDATDATLLDVTWCHSHSTYRTYRLQSAAWWFLMLISLWTVDIWNGNLWSWYLRQVDVAQEMWAKKVSGLAYLEEILAKSMQKACNAEIRKPPVGRTRSMSASADAREGWICRKNSAAKWIQIGLRRSVYQRIPKMCFKVFQAVKEVCIVCCGQWQNERLLRLQWVGEQCQQRIEKSCDRNHAAWWVSLAARDPPYF